MRPDWIRSNATSQLRAEGDPRGVLARRPPALAAGRAHPAEPPVALERSQPLPELASLLRLERGRVSDVVEVALVVVEAQEQGSDAVVVLRDAVPADHAVRGLPMLHLHPPARAAQVGLIGALRDDPVLTQPGLVREPPLGRCEVIGPGRQEEVRPGVEIVEILRRLADVQARAQLREPLPTLDEGHRREVRPVLQQVEEDQGGRDLGRELADA
jgi:hypothetical protein